MMSVLLSTFYPVLLKNYCDAVKLHSARNNVLCIHSYSRLATSSYYYEVLGFASLYRVAS